MFCLPAPESHISMGDHTQGQAQLWSLHPRRESLELRQTRVRRRERLKDGLSQLPNLSGSFCLAPRKDLFVYLKRFCCKGARSRAL